MASPTIEEAFLKLAKCFLEGPERPDNRVLPPETFTLRVWQVIPKGSKNGKLHLTIEGLTPPPPVLLKEVEVVFEGAEEQAQRLQDWKKGDELEFDLPPVWAENPGARFVTVYIREKGAANEKKEPKKAQERPTAIVRIVPAPLSSSAALDYDDHRPADDGDD